MKNNILAAAVALSFGFATAALAAPTSNTGSITITGSVGKMVALSTGADGAFGNQTVAFNATTNTLVMDDADTAVVAPAVPFRMRSNTGYELVASVATGAGHSASSDVLPADINITFADAAATGAKVMPNASRVDTSTLPAGSTLASISTTNTTTNVTSPTKVVLTGSRISNKGGPQSNDNALSSSATVSIKPQFFTANVNFEYVVTLTMLAL
jgi:hypothetical protein